MSNQRFLGNQCKHHSPTRVWLAVLLACLGALAPAAFAQTNAPGSSNRWLLIVETSKSMRGLSNEVANVAGSMVASGMKGQVRPGDTLGLWTFNDTLHDVRFPLQVLAPDANRKAAQRVREFLLGRRYEKKGRLDKALPDALQLIKDSDFITVILLSSTKFKVSGTPFDDKINAAFEALQKEETRAGLLLATVLRARHGQITDYRVMMPTREFELPPLPPEMAVIHVAPAKPAPPAKAPEVAPLIMSGSKVLSAPTTNEVTSPAPKP